MRDPVQLVRLGAASRLTQAGGGILFVEDPETGVRYNGL
jgi:hypothetical protein